MLGFPRSQMDLLATFLRAEQLGAADSVGPLMQASLLPCSSAAAAQQDAAAGRGRAQQGLGRATWRRATTGQLRHLAVALVDECLPEGLCTS